MTMSDIVCEGESTTSGDTLSFCCNAQEVSFDGSSAERLSAVLREHLDCKDVKIGCNAGDCGACTVLVDAIPVCACLTAVGQVDGRQVETLSGLEQSDSLMRQLQQSFLRQGAAQCGICTPGMLVAALALLRQNPEPNEQAVQDALGGVLCRCTGYRKIIDAVMLATQTQTPVDAGMGIGVDERPSVEQLDSVGVPLMRLDGQPKVSGQERFGDDVAPVDARVCRLLRSPFHHALFELGNLEAYQARHPGIDAIICARDIPGENAFGVIPPYIDQPVFADGCTRFKGEAVAAIIGAARIIDALDLNDFPITWEEQPAMLDPVQASRAESAQLHQGTTGNTLCEGLVQCGDAQSAVARAVSVARGTFTTGFIEHAYIEPEAGFARRVGDTIEVHGCTQAPYMNRDSLARIMGLDETAVRIVPTAVGGGFGSKLDLSYQPYVALAAWILDVPVRMTYSRQESMQSSTKRHPSRLEVEIGVESSGRLCGFRFEGTFNTGAYASWGPTVANRVPVHASGPYYVPDYRAHTTGVYTHCAPAGAFRGFGVPQAAIAQESLFDELADSIGMDRLAFRLLNALDNDQPTVTGQKFESAVGIKPCLEALQDSWLNALADAEAFNSQARDSGSSLRRGVGVASGWYGCGNTSLPNPSTIRAGIRANGSIFLHQGAMDIGQGSNTVISQIFAQSLGVSLADIELLGPDSALTPDAGKTSASRQTFVSGQAAHLTALALRDQIARLSNCVTLQQIEIRQGVLHVNPGSVDTSSIDLRQMTENEFGYVLMAEESFDPPTSPMNDNGQGIPYAQYGYAAQMVSLDVDIMLGTVRLQSLTAAHDVGRAINPLLVEGQIHGGVAQGIGLALMEEFIPGRTENLHDYLIPTIGDIPPINTIIVEVEDPHGPFGAKGLGEHVLIPTAPAILNAITHASGARIRDLPATPDKVLAAIREQAS